MRCYVEVGLSLGLLRRSATSDHLNAIIENFYELNILFSNLHKVASYLRFE